MNKNEFYYDLPEELIAQHPVEPRDNARLLVYDGNTDTVSHRRFYELTDLLRPDDLLVVNNTRVLPVRIVGTKTDTNARISFLLHKRIDGNTWETLCSPAKRVRLGTELVFDEGVTATAIAIGDGGARTLKFEYSGVFEDILCRIGEMPLPHYIHAKLRDSERYQTVYSKHTGSAAAPTAGLHFTNELIQKVKAKGVEFESVLLHVGLGTFLPVKEDNVLDHKMHSEYYSLSPETAQKINAAKRAGRRVIAVGTTSVRVLESCADSDGNVTPKSGETNIFIYPPYKFKTVDGLITNFHLPESTLIMLVSAFIGREKTLELYNIAVQEKYRFYSFGDATMLLPKTER